MIAFFWTMISFGLLALSREPPGGVITARPATLAFLRDLPRLIRQDRNLTKYLITRAVAVTGTMGGGFYAVYGLKSIGASEVDIGLFTLAMQIAQTAGTIGFGWLADRRGNLVVLTFGALATGLSAIVAAASGSPLPLYGAFVLLGLGIAATNISGMTIGLELGPEAERPTYVAINNSAAAPFALVAPIAAGFLADRLGFPPLFLLAAAISIAAALMFHLLVDDPRQLRARPAATG
jgi:MFS family permease